MNKNAGQLNGTASELSARFVSGRVHWIGATDPGLRNFDIILNTPNGTTYNSYAVRGSDGVAVIDTVKAELADEFFARLESVVRYDEIKWIVLNHLEPDHTGALPELMRRAPQACLYISESAQVMLKALLKTKDIPFTPVGTDDQISLGDRHLRFLHTPFLHWPDTQCTYLEEDAILFSGDVFGCHFCDEHLFNDEIGDFSYAFDYYYAHIMRPFKSYVLKALDLIEPLKLEIVAPAHGPILRDRPERYVHRYRELSTPQARLNSGDSSKSMLVFYISSYGNTKHMAEAIGEGIGAMPGFNVALYDLEGTELEPLIDMVEAADAIVIGTPTINGDAVKPVWDLLSSFATISVQGKVAASFGSYGWSGEAVRMLDDRLRGLKMRVPVTGLRIKLIPTPDELDACRIFGRDICNFMLGIRSERVIDMAELLASETN